MASEINHTFMRFTRRAEVVERQKLVETFVDAGPLMTLLNTVDHQILYGRRGTGKTHALNYLLEQRRALNDVTVFVDLRQIGSTGGLLSDPNIPIGERGTRLLMDTLAAIHDALVDHVLVSEMDLREVGPHLDSLADAITEVSVVGEVAVENDSAEADGAESKSSIAGAVIKPQLSFELGNITRREASSRTRRTETGIERCRVHFGRLAAALKKISDALTPKRIWIVLDEWSSVSLDLQPLLADLIRRSLLPIQGYSIKVAAIEQRTKFRVPLSEGDYLGFEIGADLTADVNLDDFMVFENDAERAKSFFGELVFKHYLALQDGQDEGDRPRTKNQLIRQAFTQENVFEEFIRSAEGVPRDAINIIGLCAQRALDDSISMGHLRQASKSWYQRDKEAAVNSNPKARDMLHWIIEEVIGNRRARAFLLQSDKSHELIDSLFDARVLHILKRSISAHDQPGVRFNVYKLDYGCYVDLVSTIKAPLGLFQLDNDEPEASGPEEARFTEVPPDDYRSIRRAILVLDRFENSQRSKGADGIS